VLVAAVLLASGVASTGATHRSHRLSGGSFTSTVDTRWTVLARSGARGSKTFALS
jgi:hypothetical protein